jgi:hypothetical protein
LPVALIRPVGDQATTSGEDAFEVDRGQFVPGRKCDDQFAMAHPGCARRNDQAAVGRLREGRDGALDLSGVVQLTGLTSILRDGATACMVANWLVPPP